MRQTQTTLEAIEQWRADPRTQATQRRNDERWTQTLIAQARDDSDPETRDNARALLTARGIAF